MFLSYSDIDECLPTQSVCIGGHCENTLGSFTCSCKTGYKLQHNTCMGKNNCDWNYDIEK
ncbi:MAG: calcium-binding EGF-like domain-containing protein [Plesiomonas shigelloides]